MPAEHLNSQITLAELLAGFAEAPELAITGIASDSRKVEPGDLFLACEGFTRHGLDFANDVVRQGAVAISFDSSTARTVPQDLDIVLVPIAGLAAKLGEIANRYFASPSSDVGVVGVTGTNGKSTVAWLVTQCLAHLSRKCGYSGTLGYGLNELDSDDDMTSPDVVEIHRRLAMFRDLGAVHAAMEVSSLALDQARIAGVQFDATLFTNLSRDHIDDHGDMRAYGDAKAKLFTDYPARVRIVN
ncbi:MAG: Mur ligase family protein, partial [Woeseiaceae bacterium]